MTDSAAIILAFLFNEDKEMHPMPPNAVNAMFQKIRSFIYRKGVIQCGQAKPDTLGDQGADG
jgi:hypothetical protein